MNINGSKIIVTGAASGMGRSISIKMAQLGAHLILTDINEQGLEQTDRLIADFGGKVLTYKALNIADIDEVKAFANEIENNFGTIDILINVAGILVFAEIQDMTHQDWKKVMDVNFWGTVHTIESFVPQMIKQRRGHVVNMGSLCSLVGYPWQAAYTASKHAILGLSEVLRYDLRRYNIGVSIICPAAVKTEMVRSAKIVTDNKDKVEKTRRSFSMVGVSPEYIAEKVVKAIEKDKFIVVTPDLGWIWYLKRYIYPLYVFYQRFFCWVWNKQMK